MDARARGNRVVMPSSVQTKALRRSYRDLANLPSWMLVDLEGQTVASVRAHNNGDARHIFEAHGVYVTRLDRIMAADVDF
jgi:hypothetical protein